MKNYLISILKRICYLITQYLRNFSAPLYKKFEDLETTMLSIENKVAKILDNLDVSSRTLQSLELRQKNLAYALKLYLDYHHYTSVNLADIRSSQSYLDAYILKSDPVISVVITTHTAPNVLFERTIPSILTQSWSNSELILVVDSLDPKILQRFKDSINKFSDNRIKVFYTGLKLEILSDYKTNWRNSGSFGTNYGLSQATGQWIAMFAHDDELIEGSFESLIKYAIDSKIEFCYSKFNMIVKELTLNHGSYPPVLGQFNIQGSIINSSFKKILHHQYDSLCDIPNDWGYLLRIYNLGLHIGFLNQTTVNFYPSSMEEIYEAYKLNN